MNYIDIAILVIVAWFAYKGFTKGLIIEIASIVALLLGIYAAFHFSVFASTILQNNLGIKSSYLPVISFIVTFLVVIILVFVLAKLLEGLVNLVMLGIVNKVAGAIFGIIKAFIIVSVLIFALNIANGKSQLVSEQAKAGSLLYKPLLATGRFIMQWANVNQLYPKISSVVQSGK